MKHTNSVSNDMLEHREGMPSKRNSMMEDDCGRECWVVRSKVMRFCKGEQSKW